LTTFYRSFATIENLEAGENALVLCAHLNKSYGAKHVMHGGDAETFIEH
jgi:hypothetical protein